MKLIVGGSTGFVATEIIRQSVSNPSITSIVALGRRPAPTPDNLLPNADLSKLKSVILADFGTDPYPDAVKAELAGADACIWTIAVTPSQLKTTPWETTVKICRDYAVNGIRNISTVASSPFRFVYISGNNAERDQTKKPLILGDYCLMRGETETRVLEFARNSGGKAQVAIAKPGIISGPGHETGFFAKAFFAVIGLPKVRVGQIAATLIEVGVKGSADGKDTYNNDDLVSIGTRILGTAEGTS